MTGEIKEDPYGFYRRINGQERDQTPAKIAAAKGALAAVHPRYVSGLLDFAAEGGATKERQALLRKKPRRRRGQQDPDQRKGPSDAQEKLLAEARSALAALPRQSHRDEVVAWAKELGIGLPP